MSGLRLPDYAVPVRYRLTSPKLGPRVPFPQLPRLPLLLLLLPKHTGNGPLSPPRTLGGSGRGRPRLGQSFTQLAPRPRFLSTGLVQFREATRRSCRPPNQPLPPRSALGARAPSVRACVRACEHVRPRNVQKGGGRKREARGGAAVAMTVTSGVRERTRPFPHARARARAHRDMHTGAHRRSPSDTLEGKVKLKARELGGRSRRCAP